jgi:hypothetical protein
MTTLPLPGEAVPWRFATCVACFSTNEDPPPPPPPQLPAASRPAGRSTAACHPEPVEGHRTPPATRPPSPLGRSQVYESGHEGRLDRKRSALQLDAVRSGKAWKAGGWSGISGRSTQVKRSRLGGLLFPFSASRARRTPIITVPSLFSANSLPTSSSTPKDRSKSACERSLAASLCSTFVTEGRASPSPPRSHR